MRFLRLLFIIASTYYSLAIANDENDEYVKQAKNRRDVVLCNPCKTLKFSTEKRSKYFFMMQIGSDNLKSIWQFNTAHTTGVLYVNCVMHDGRNKLYLSTYANRGDLTPYYTEIVEIFLSKFANAGWVINASPYSDLAKTLEMLGFTTKGDKSFLECDLTYTINSKKSLDEKSEKEELKKLSKKIRQCHTINKIH